MIISDFDHNWTIIEILLEQTYSNYIKTKGTEFRGFLEKEEAKNIFDEEKEEYIENERALVTMTLAWISITIEALVNNIIAEIIPNRILATYTIENAKQIVDRFPIEKKPKYEIACKLLILNENHDGIDKFIEVAEEMVNIRNRIVHDKPISVDLPNGEEKFSIYSTKAKGDGIFYYENMRTILLKYDSFLDHLIDNYKDKILLFRKI